MTSGIPKATHVGVLKIGNIEIQCAVLENGQRVLTQEGFLLAMGRSGKATGGKGASVDDTPAFLSASNLKPFISKELAGSTRAMTFRMPKGNKAFGYSADLLPKVCDVFLDADAAGNVILPQQRHIVAQAKILIRGLAHVGIIALVDEATGYQYERSRNALEEILETFLAKELGRWAKTFPDAFYEEMFRLRKWSFTAEGIKRRPGIVGKYTNDLVYMRLAPGILDELRKRNPPNKRGNRKNRHFQWLTEDVGHPKLREHLWAVITLMKASNDWGQLMRMINRALPKWNDTMALPMFDKDPID